MCVQFLYINEYEYIHSTHIHLINRKIANKSHHQFVNFHSPQKTRTHTHDLMIIIIGT